MVDRIYLLFEILSILLFLWVLHGSKKKPGICTVIYVCIELIIVSLIQEGWINSEYVSFVYLGIVAVDILEFDDKIDNAIIYTLLILFFILGCQLFLGIAYTLITHTETVSNIAVLYIHVIIFIICCFAFVKLDLHKPVSSFLEKEHITNIIFIVLGSIVFFLFIKKISTLELQWDLVVMSLLSFSIIMVILIRLGKESLQKKQYIEQLHQYEQYNIVYKDLIQEIRHRQHDFDNHLQAIYSIALAYDDIVELRKEQFIYLEKMKNEHHLCHFVKESSSSVLSAFLYVKFKTFKEKGINIYYDMNFEYLEKRILFPDIVELIGNLLDNAAEAVLKKEQKRIWFILEEKEDTMHLQVSNLYEWNAGDYANDLLKEHYSTKGDGHGFGLTNVKKVIEKYKGSIQILFDTKDDDKIVIFDIILPFNKEVSK